MRKKTVIILLTTLLGVNGCFGGITENKVLAASETTDVTEQSQVLLDQDGIYVEYRGIVEHSSESWIVNLYVENNMQSDFYISLRNVVINGCYCSLANSGTTIQMGSKYLAEPNYNFVLDTDTLSAYGITEITDINFDIYVSTEMLGDEILTSPAKIDNINKKSTAELSEITPEKELLNQDDVHVQYCGISDYSSSSKIVNLYVENNRDSAICVSLTDTLINGYNISLSNNNAPVPAHAKFLAAPNFELIIDTDDLAAYGISEIDTITGNLKIKTSMLGDVISETPVDLTMTVTVEPEQKEKKDTETTGSDTYEARSSTSSSASTPLAHYCEKDGCYKEGIHEITGFSGQIEYYCDQHYQDIQDIINMMEEDVGTGSASRHQCEVSGCNKEGTNSVGNEWYCTQHYQKMVDMLSSMYESTYGY